MEFIEFQTWGYNIHTMCFIMIMIFATLQGITLITQCQAVWEKQSGESLSASWIIYFMFMFTSIFVFGLHMKGFALVYNGSLALLHIPILRGLHRFKGFTKTDKYIAALCIAMILVMILTPLKSAIFLSFSFGSILAQALQPWEMWKTKRTGVVDIKLIFTYLFATIFWIIYAFAFDQWEFKIISPAIFMVLLVTILFWITYKRKESHE